MMTTKAVMTPRRMSLPNFLADEEGQRIQVPEGGELVCYRTDGRLSLKIEYSREMMVKLSSSIFCHERPREFARIIEETPELLGLPTPIPLTSAPPPTPSPSIASPVPTHRASPLHLYSPMRGPVQAATEQMRLLSIQREFNKRMLELESTHEETISPSRH